MHTGRQVLLMATYYTSSEQGQLEPHWLSGQERWVRIPSERFWDADALDITR